MTSVLIADRQVIARARVHTARRGDSMVPLRAKALLERLELRPPGLSSSSLLFIRALPDPLPGRVSLERGGEDASAPWREAVTDSVARFARAAARPALAPVPSHAEAVLFVDEAEMIACLVRDWLHGRVPERWWWRSVLGGLSPPEWLRRYVLSRGELLVPAVSTLAAGPEAAAWLARLEDGEAEEALRAVAHSHSLAPAAARAACARSADVREARASAKALERLVAIVPEAHVRSLRPPQRRLMAIVLALARAPAWARTRRLVPALDALDRAHPDFEAEWSAIRQAPEQDKVLRPVPDGDAGAPPREKSGRRAMPRGETKASPGAVPDEETVTSVLTRAAASAAALPDANAREGKAASAAARTAPRRAPSAAARSEVSEARASPVDAPPAERFPSPAPLSLEPARLVATAFGGIFYLLNAALAMGLYSDFSAPRGKNLRCSPWNWLALVGREWFGREFVRDPVWGVLAGLAGRKRRGLRRPRRLARRLEDLLARLALALGEEPSADVAARVCRHRARLAVGAARVDVHLALAELPLELRIAGLDRDPGWIPAAGRSIAFHFE